MSVSTHYEDYEEESIQNAKRRAVHFAQTWKNPALLRSSAAGWGPGDPTGNRHQRLWYLIAQAYYAAAAERAAGIDPCA